jgi:hypothetical protein
VSLLGCCLTCHRILSRSAEKGIEREGERTRRTELGEVSDEDGDEGDDEESWEDIFHGHGGVYGRLQDENKNVSKTRGKEGLAER